MNARSDSLFRKVQEAGKLDELMMFLEDAPAPKEDEPADRWVRGSVMVNGWGIKCGRSAIWSLYKSYVLYWRMLVANGAAQTTEDISSFDEKARRMAAQRTFEMLSDPEMPPKILVGLARLQIARQRAENDSRRVNVLEGQFKRLQEIVDGAKSKGGGGLTKETLEKIERELKLI